MVYTKSDLAFFAAHEQDIAQADGELTLTKKTQLADAVVLRQRFGDHGRAVAELIAARRSGKFPSTWWADSEAAQQATPPQVADHRARYLRDCGVDAVHDVTCSIGTEGHHCISAGIEYMGSDLDLMRVAAARHNVPGGSFAVADALVPVSDKGVVIADPARRAGGTRITDPSKLLPPLPDLVAAYSEREMVVKCAPGLDISSWRGQVSVVSVDGAVKEASLYTPGLSRTARQAVMLRADGGIDTLEGISNSELDAPEPGPPGKFIIDPDGAIVRAGLVQHYAVREGLWQLDERIAYLTGDRIPAGRSGFRFIEQVSLKRLKSALAAHDAGSVEILVRGLDIDPDQLRRKLSLKGKHPMGVVLTRIGSRGVALICQARETGQVG